MGKKLEALAEEADESDLATAIRNSAANIWLAGLGAFAMAQEEGEKLFDTLVKEGKKVQKSAKKSADAKIAAIDEKASTSWDKLEQVFEDRVAQALQSLGVPTRKDVDALAGRVAELTAVVEKLSATMKDQPGKRTARRRSKATEA